MHKGHNYPFHPSYWATEAWFWPGFVPWKLRVSWAIDQDPPWDIIGGPSDLISAAGRVLDYGEIIRYRVALNPDATAQFLDLSLDRFRYLELDYARWTVAAIVEEVPVATAYEYQDFPQREVYADPNLWIMNDYPGSGTAGPTVTAVPASYQDGGSPWGTTLTIALPSG